MRSLRRVPAVEDRGVFGDILKRLVKGYGVLLMTAAGGLVGANLSGFIGAFFVPEHTAEHLRAWVHWGWVAGAGLFLFGALTRRLRVVNSSMLGLRPTPPAGARSDAVEEIETNVGRPKRRYRDIPVRDGRRVGALCGAAVFGFAGAITGAAVGGSFLLLWFSLTYSPFSPAGWESSVRVEEIRAVDPPRDVPVLATKHPVALYAFFGPIVLGAAAGAIVGGIAAAAGKVTEG